eukprot:7388592-Prymnesium_polylepis.1
MHACNSFPISRRPADTPHARNTTARTRARKSASHGHGREAHGACKGRQTSASSARLADGRGFGLGFGPRASRDASCFFLCF